MGEYVTMPRMTVGNTRSPEQPRQSTEVEISMIRFHPIVGMTWCLAAER